MKDIRIAAALVNARLGETAYNLKRTKTLAAEAAEKGATLICFPEMNITGYSSRKKIREHAVTINGEITDTLQETAERHKITILAGIAERSPRGELFASHLVLCPGKTPGIYRKTHLAPPEADDFSAGSELPLFKIENFTFGIQLCYDAHFPHLSTCMAEAGADALFIPHASPRGTPEEKLSSWMRHLPARAYDNGMFVIACNQSGDNHAGLTFPGTALVLDPSGNVLTQCATMDETLVLSDLKKEALLKVREHRMRYFLPNRRKDIRLAE